MKFAPIRFDTALGREWLLTNCLGSYASSSLLDCHTRKYHGLLVAALSEPPGHFVLLSQLEAALSTDGGSWTDLATNQYPGAIHPRGFQHQESFDALPIPETAWRVEETLLKRELILCSERNALLVRYQLHEGPSEIKLRLAPLLAFRDRHTTTKENHFFRGNAEEHSGVWRMRPYAGMPEISFAFEGGAGGMRFHAEPHWRRDLEYREEINRGLDAREDLFCPGSFETTLKKGQPLFVEINVGETNAQGPGTLPLIWKTESEKIRAEWETYASEGDSSLGILKYTAGSFFVRPQKKLSIVAGYHWFGQWGRDAMIALPGLAFYSGRTEAGTEVLKTFTAAMKHGLIPNYFGSGENDHAYNSVDASLWFFFALSEYWDRGEGSTKTKLEVFKKYFLAPMKEILSAFQEGRATNVFPQASGLIAVGSEATQLTWMDAQVRGKPVTPRHGLAVEINALYHHGLTFTQEIMGLAGDSFPAAWTATVNGIRASFETTYTDKKFSFLADTVNEHGKDFSIRPNQLFAVSLRHSPLAYTPSGKSWMNQIVETAARHLATPYGLRTLSPESPWYRLHYGGDSESRDSAYHQGTVWAWLTGSYVEAALRVAEDPKKKARELLDYFQPLFETHIGEYGVGSIAEIFDAEAPHTPKGTISQAWSVAEVIRSKTLLAEALASPQTIKKSVSKKPSNVTIQSEAKSK